MSSTEVSPPPQRVEPVTDEVTVLGFAVGWALIVLGLIFLVVALTN